MVLKSPLHGMDPGDSSLPTLGTLLQAGKESCDVTIVCPAADKQGSARKSEMRKTQEGREFPCHKLVLTTRSDVFAAMFRQDQDQHHQD